VDEVDDAGGKVLDRDGKAVQVPATDGKIIYIKPVFYGNEPRDIYHYAMTHDDFPHERTGDQWFNEAQFESYRKLGSYMIDTTCKGTDDGSISVTGRNDPALLAFLNKAQQCARAKESESES
jgi:hypothetical protein